MRGHTLASLLAAAAFAGMAATPAGVAAPKAALTAPVTQAQRRQIRQLKSFIAATRVHRGGWSVAHDRRMAKKRRNVLRNRRAHRG